MNEIVIKYQAGELASRYINYLDAQPRTVGSYQTNIRQFVKYLSSNGITHPTREDILAWREELKKKCKPATVQAYITAIRLFFQWTEQEGLYPNIANHIKGAKLDRSHKKDYLTSEQVRNVLSKIDRSSIKGVRDYAITLLMVTGGLRDIEVSRANVEDLQTLGNSTVLFLQGKGREERSEYIKLIPETETAIREYLSTRKEVEAKAPLFASTSNNNSGKRLSTKSISTLVKNALVNAGYNSERLTAHSLRHTAVTLALIGGLPLEEVQQFARHSNIATTQIYAHNLERMNNRSEATIGASIFKK